MRLEIDPTADGLEKNLLFAPAQLIVVGLVVHANHFVGARE